jgi:hypothetical protein
MADNAAIYISDPTLLGTKFFKKFGEIKTYEDLQEGDRPLRHIPTNTLCEASP